MTDRDTEIREWLDYRGLPADTSLKDLIEHERGNAKLAVVFDQMRAGADRAREAFATVERLAPRPDSRDAPVDDWTRHYAALALAAHALFREAERTIPPNPVPGSRPDLGYLIMIAGSSTAAAVALTTHPDEVAGELSDLTPEAGEDVDWLAAALDRLGVNPADLYRWYDAKDFTSKSAAVPA